MWNFTTHVWNFATHVWNFATHMTSPDHDSRHCCPIHINALQYIYPIHILKMHSNTYEFSPIYMSNTYEDVVQYIYPHIYIGHMSWTYILDRFSQGCICIGQHYMSWSACNGPTLKFKFFTSRSSFLVKWLQSCS